MAENMFDKLLAYSRKGEIEKFQSCNQFTSKFGLSLSEEDGLILLDSRKYSLKEQERIEFGEGVIVKLIYAFCDSPYIHQDNNVDTINDSQDIFYLYKNEALDEVTDDELIAFMKEHFNTDCQGSLDFLAETVLDAFAREIRNGTRKFIGLYEEKE